MERRILNFMLTLLLFMPFGVMAQGVPLVIRNTSTNFATNTVHYICNSPADDPDLTLTATVSPAIVANSRIDLAIQVWNYGLGGLIEEVQLDNSDKSTSTSISTVSWDIVIGNSAITTNVGSDNFNRRDAVYKFKGTYAGVDGKQHEFFTDFFRLREGEKPQVKITAANATVSSWAGSNNFTILKGCVNNDPRLRVNPAQCGSNDFTVLATEVDIATGNWLGTQINKNLNGSERNALLSSVGLPINGLTDGTTTLTLATGKLYSIAVVYVGQNAWQITYANMMYKDGTWDLVMHDNANDVGFEPGDIWDDNIFNSADLWNKLSTTGTPNTIDNEPPTQVTVLGNSNKMMVKITNAGCSTSTAAGLTLYWTRARTDEFWDSHWKYDITTSNYTTNAAFGTTHLPLGSEITIGGTMSVPYSISSTPHPIGPITNGSSYTIPYASAIDWFPPNPDWYNASNGSMTGNSHPVICLLARINDAGTTNDPMVWQPLGNLKINPYVKKNNNVVTRNTYVVAKPGFFIMPNPTDWNYGFGTVLVNNPDLTPRTVRLCVDLIPDGVTTGTFNTYGSMEIGTTTGLYNAWLAGGSVGTNVVATTPTLFTVTNGTHACIENITLAPGFSEQIGVRYNYNCATLPAEPRQYSYSLSQSSGSGETLVTGSNAVYIADVPVTPPAGVNGCTMSKNNTGIAGIASQDGLYLYPNPTSGYVDVSMDSKDFKAVAVNVYDITGRMVASQPVADKTTIRVDATKLTAGTYILKINDANGITRQARFVKE